jgi:hypothetical protein
MTAIVVHLYFGFYSARDILRVKYSMQRKKTSNKEPKQGMLIE